MLLTKFTIASFIIYLFETSENSGYFILCQMQSSIQSYSVMYAIDFEHSQ